MTNSRTLLRLAHVAALLLVALFVGEVRSEPGEDSPADSTAPEQPTDDAAKRGKAKARPPAEGPFRRRQSGAVKEGKAGRRQQSARQNPLPGKGGDRDLLLASHAFQRGRSRVAVSRLLIAIAKYPEMVRVHTMLGIADVQGGWYGDAVGEFAFGRFDVYYEREGIPHHALALRMCGRGDEAAALRLTERVMLDDDEKDLTLLIEAGEDLLTFGDIAGAEELLTEAVGLYPRSSASHAAYADFLFATGREDEGELELYLAFHNGAPSFKARMLEAERKLATGDFRGAEKELNRAGSARPRSLDVGAMLAKMYVRSGSPAEALTSLQSDALSDNQHPGLAAVEIEALVATGQTAQAKARLTEALRVSPGYPDLVEVARLLAP